MICKEGIGEVEVVSNWSDSPLLVSVGIMLGVIHSGNVC